MKRATRFRRALTALRTVYDHWGVRSDAATIRDEVLATITRIEETASEQRFFVDESRWTLVPSGAVAAVAAVAVISSAVVGAYLVRIAGDIWFLLNLGDVTDLVVLQLLSGGGL